MARNDPAIQDDTPNNSSTQMQLISASAAPTHPAVTSIPLPHLGDFVNKLVDDAYRFQNLSVELDQTKEKLREADNRIAELAIDNQTIQEDLKNVRELLGVARDDESSAKIQLRVYEDSVKSLEATLRGMDSALRDMGTTLSGSIPRSKIANYRSILDKIHQCHMENTLAVSSILTYDRERRNNPRINEQVNKLNEATCDITSHFNALYDAFESDLTEASTSSV